MQVDVIGDDGELEYTITVDRKNTNDYEYYINDYLNDVEDKTGMIYNHNGGSLEILETILNGRHLSSKATALLRN